MRNKSLFAWILAVVITISAAIYQRLTGPTYPRSFKIETSSGEYKFKLKRSHNNSKECFIELKNSPENLTGKLYYRLYPGNYQWESVDFENDGKNLRAKLPNQPAAGKLEYYIVFNDGEKQIKIADDNPVVIRFKGDVPAGFMIPHVLFMFFAMLFSNLTGILILFKDSRYRKYLKIAFIFLFIGGAILGPIIQKYAFGHYWTGWPFGEDLTDNKTLIGLIFYAVAFITNYKKENPRIAFVAVVVLFIVYMIPHSMFGSELDHNTGQVITGK